MSFEFDGEKYKTASTHQKEWGTKLISGLNLTGNEKILDLGCGDGRITCHLAEMVPNGFVLGIDASKSMIHSAENTHKARNLRFELIDINEIDFENEFDIVISNAALHWVKDHEKLLSKVFNALKTDGIAHFNFAADGNCSTLYKVLQEAMARKKYTGYFDHFDWPWYMPTIQEYEKLLKTSDFTETKVCGENADRFFPDKDAMVRWIDQPSLVPFLKHIDGQDKKTFRDNVVERMAEEMIRDDGRYFETFRRINVWAKK